MSELTRTFSAFDVAKALGETERYVRDKCGAGEWPHRRGSRNTPRFTQADFDRILELIAVPEEGPQTTRLALAPRSRRAS
jgi:hypothetical protein